jgi:hypothetical protein
MRKLILLVLACSGCIYEPAYQPAYTAYAPPQPDCRAFSSQIMVDGQPQPATGTACRQPDGSWRVTQQGQDQQPQVYVIPAAPQYQPDYPYWAYDPYWAPSIGLSGTFLFGGGGDGFHHGFDRGGGFHRR